MNTNSCLQYKIFKIVFIFLDVVAGKQIQTYKHLLNSHTERLEKIHILKNTLFIFKSPVNIKVKFLVLIK